MEDSAKNIHSSNQNSKSFFERIPSPLKNKYILTSLGFIIWLLFFDRHDIISQIKLSKELKKMEEKKAFYLKEIENDSKKLNELLTNPKTLEKFAREKYLMKKDNEDIFVVVNE
ncbi:MAG: septum formation initiator family protein [Bacteroidia bacterium]